MPTMTPTEGAEKLVSLIERNYTHDQYKENSAQAKFWRSIMSGKDQDDIVTSYKSRETEDQKKQRIKISHTPTVEAYTRVTAPMDRLDNPDGLIREIKYAKGKEGNLPFMLERTTRFHGDKPLDQYVQEGFVRYNTSDANAFLLIGATGDRDANGVWKEKPWPQPETIPCEEVYDFTKVNGVYTDLTRREILMKKKPTSKELIPVHRFTIYFTGYIIQATELNEASKPEGVNNGVFTERTLTVDKKQVVFAFVEYKTGLDETPFIEWGFVDDDDQDSKISVLTPVETKFRQLVNRSSELELNIALHVFYEKFKFVPRCAYVQKGHGRCEDGIMSASREECPRCKGTGKMFHTTTQDVILFDMPESRDEMIALSEMTHIPVLPFEIVDFLKKEIPDLHTEMEQTMWGINLASPPQGESLTPTTATEIISRYDTVYKRLGKMGVHKARIWQKCVRLVAKYAEINEGLEAKYEFPASFQMETIQELLILLKAAKDSGAPYAVISAIEYQVMKKQGQVSTAEIEWHNAMHAFMPFKSKSAADIGTIIAGLPEADYYRVLWTYFDEIFEEIRQEKPQFPLLEFAERKKVVQEKVNQFVEQVKANVPEAAPARGLFDRVPAN